MHDYNYSILLNFAKVLCMKTAIVYASIHHNNTYRVVKVLSEEYGIELIDATKQQDVDLNEYDRIGFASGIYYSKFHKSVLDFAANNLPEGKEVFYLCTYGGKAVFKSIESVVAPKNCRFIGSFSCEGYDTYGPFKLVGGIKKGHPSENDLKNAVKFYSNIREMYD